MNNKKNGEKSGWSYFWGAVAIIVVLVIWFKNTHPDAHYNGLQDYRDTWFTGSKTVRALYCGKSPNFYCNPNGNWFYSTATWNGKDKAASSDTKWVHYFTLRFPNGGWIETEATCDKAASGWYFYDRFCEAYAYDEYGDEVLYLIVPDD